MKLYLVIKAGVSMRDVFGVFDSFDKAVMAKDKAISLEPDDYHGFFIQEAILNTEGYLTYLNEDY